MSISKSAISAIAAWSVGFACFAALIHTLRAPILPPASESEPPVEASVRVEPPQAKLIELAPILIVGHRRTPPLRRVAPEVHELRCGDWRPLTQGDESQLVRLCE